MDLYKQIFEVLNISSESILSINKSGKVFNLLFTDNTVSSYTIDDVFRLLLKNTIKVSPNDKSFLQELSQEMKTQDTRCTAQPYGLVISQEHIIKGYDTDYGCDIVYRNNELDSEYYDEDFGLLISELRDWLSESEWLELQGDIEKHDIKTLYYLDLYCSHLIPKEFEIIGYEKERTADSMNGCYEGNFFLTEKAAKEYIEKNKHNLNNPGTYGIHLYRNSEMQRLYKFILNIKKD